MAKPRRRRVEKKSIQNNIIKCDENTMALAIVKAYHIIENEKKKMEEEIDTNKRIKSTNKEKWYIKSLFMLNVFFFPWKINKRFTINDKIYDSVLVLFVSLILSLIGFVIWLMGFGTIAYKLMMLLQGKNMGVYAWSLTTGILMVMFGSLITLASGEFSKVSESNTIYAYSASIIALISCILTVISMI